MSGPTALAPIAPRALDYSTLSTVLVGGDLSVLNDEQRFNYVIKVCETIGVNPYTRPFAYIRLSGKLVLYALKDCTDQLRTIHDISITELTSQQIGDVYIVTARALHKDGRIDMATGAVAIGGAKGEALANLFLKCETKAKRRVTLSICGLGMLDETETETIPNAEILPAPARTPAAAAASAAPAEKLEIIESTRIVRVERRPATGRGTAWAEVTLAPEGRMMFVFGDDMIVACEVHQRDRTAVKIAVGKTSKGFDQIVRVVAAAPPPAATELTDDDIPF